MDERLKQLFALVVEDVIETAEPVGSQSLVEKHQLEVSSATVRNWFAQLEEQGLMMQPHTSSGRIPTERGYRLYVDELLDRRPLGKRDRQELEQIAADQTDRARRIKVIAKRIAEISGNAIVVGLGEADTYYTGLSQLFAQPEFRDWNRMVSLSQILDRLDEVLNAVRRTRFDQPVVLIGQQCPFGSACSSMMFTLEDGTLFGVLGPMRMDYRRGFALLSTIQELMSQK